MTPPRKLLNGKEVEERTGRSRTQRWRDIKAGKFPAPIETGPNQVEWYEDEIAAWQESRPRRTYGATQLYEPDGAEAA